MRRDALALYRLPYLRIDGVTWTADGLELSWGNDRIALSISGDITGAAALLLSMRTPSGLAPHIDGEAKGLVAELEALGWIRESEVTDTEPSAGDFETIARRASKWVEVDGGGEETIGVLASALAEVTDPIISCFNETGLYRATLILMLRSLASGAPLALRVLREIAVQRTRFEFRSDLLVSHEVATVERAVWTALCLAVSVRRDRQLTNIGSLASVPMRIAGIDAVHEAEAALEKLMASRDPLLLRVISSGTGLIRAACGVYLHQYYITTRYLMSVANWLRPSMSLRLANRILGYLQEEIGHDIHELEACRAMGLSDTEINRFAALPIFGAYPWVLDAIASEDPLAFALCISLAEGLPGTRKPVLEALRTQGLSAVELGKHQAIDEGGDHTAIAREIGVCFPSVDNDRVAKAISRFLFAAELSQLGWDQVAMYALDNTVARSPVVFGQNLDSLLSCTP